MGQSFAVESTWRVGGRVCTASAFTAVSRPDESINPQKWEYIGSHTPDVDSQLPKHVAKLTAFC
jgi:hypothetical protein